MVNYESPGRIIRRGCLHSRRPHAGQINAKYAMRQTDLDRRGHCQFTSLPPVSDNALHTHPRNSMGESIRTDILYAIFPGTWDTPANVAQQIGQDRELVDQAIEELLNEGVLQMKVEDDVALFGLTRAVTSDDEILVWMVRRLLKKEFGKMPTAEAACKHLESLNWNLQNGQSEQHVFQSLAAHLKVLNGKDLVIDDWHSATLAILEVGLLR